MLHFLISALPMCSLLHPNHLPRSLTPPLPGPHTCALCAAFFSSATFGSGAEWDWQAPGGTQYEQADYGAAFGALDLAGGFGAAPAGGAGGADDGLFGGSDFFALQSDDWTEDFVSEVGDGRLLFGSLVCHLAGWMAGGVVGWELLYLLVCLPAVHDALLFGSCWLPQLPLLPGRPASSLCRLSCERGQLIPAPGLPVEHHGCRWSLMPRRAAPPNPPNSCLRWARAARSGGRSASGTPPPGCATWPTWRTPQRRSCSRLRKCRC